MSRKTWGVGVGVGAVIALLIACGVENVKASDYDQSCKVAGDCVLVDELTGTADNHCSVSCTKGVINKNAKEKYDKEYADEEKECTDIQRPQCASPSVALCTAGKCTVSTLTDDQTNAIADAGKD